jgi:hypothetical protein
MEYWNTGRLVFKRIPASFNNILNTNFIINSKLHYPGTHYSNIPSFPPGHKPYRLEANWGEVLIRVTSIKKLKAPVTCRQPLKDLKN